MEEKVRGRRGLRGGEEVEVKEIQSQEEVQRHRESEEESYLWKF